MDSPPALLCSACSRVPGDPRPDKCYSARVAADIRADATGWLPTALAFYEGQIGKCGCIWCSCCAGCREGHLREQKLLGEIGSKGSKK